MNLVLYIFIKRVIDLTVYIVTNKKLMEVQAHEKETFFFFLLLIKPDPVMDRII